MITIATAFAAAATISTTKLCKWMNFFYLGEVPPMIIFPKRGNEKTHQ